MKILVVTLRFPPYIQGGYERLTYDAVEGLRSRGHEVFVLAGKGRRFEDPYVLPKLEPSLDPERNLFEEDVQAAPLERLALHFFRRKNYRATRQILKDLRPDLVLYFNLGLVSLAPLVAAKVMGIPRLGYACDRWPENHWLRTMRKQPNKSGRLKLLQPAWRALKCRAGMVPLLTASAWLRKHLLEDGWCVEDVRVLPTGLSPEMEGLARAARPSRRVTGERLRVVSTSMLWQGKGQHVLVEAFGRAIEEGLDADLVLAGGPSRCDDYVEQLVKLASDAKILDRVEFTGVLEPAQLSRTLCKSHVFVLPSLWGEPFGLATIEAMAHGVCTLVSDSGASAELVGSAGIVLPTGDVLALTRCLLELSGDENRRLKLGLAARERALALFSHDVFIDCLEAEAEALV